MAVCFFCFFFVCLFFVVVVFVCVFLFCVFFFFFFFFFWGGGGVLSRDDALRLTSRSKPVTSANYTGQNWFWGVSAFNKSDVSWRCLLFLSSQVDCNTEYDRTCITIYILSTMLCLNE